MRRRRRPRRSGPGEHRVGRLHAQGHVHAAQAEQPPGGLDDQRRRQEARRVRQVGQCARGGFWLRRSTTWSTASPSSACRRPARRRRRTACGDSGRTPAGRAGRRAVGLEVVGSSREAAATQAARAYRNHPSLSVRRLEADGRVLLRWPRRRRPLAVRRSRVAATSSPRECSADRIQNTCRRVPRRVGLLPLRGLRERPCSFEPPP